MSALQRALGPLAVERDGVVTLVPTSTRQLTDALQILASQHAALHRDAQLSLAELKHLGKVEPRSGTVEAGGGMTLGALDGALAEHQLTLGPLSGRMRALTLAAFLQGPDAGLRAIPGGRLEPLCLAITAVLPDGRLYRSHPSPRSAAGPDLVALLLGAGGRLSVIAEATVRCFPLPAARRSQVFSFPTAEAFVTALQSALADGAWLDSVRVQTRAERIQVEFNCLGAQGAVERDLDSLGRRAFDVGGRPTGRTTGEFPVEAPGVHPEPGEHEATWDAVREAVAAARPVTLHRLALGSVIARGEVGGLPMDRATAWWPPLAHLAAAIDPRGVLGGAP